MTNASSNSRRIGIPTQIAPFAVFALVLIAAYLSTPNFAHIAVRDGRLFGTPIDILHNGTIVSLLAIGMTLVIAAGCIDLSVGSAMALCGAVAAMVLNSDHPSPLLALGAGLACGAGCGLVNGCMVRLAGLQPIIATLVSLIAFRGLAQTLTDDQKVRFTAPLFESLARGTFAFLPIPLVLVLVAAASAYIFTHRTSAGLHIRALGGNPLAAAYCGLPTMQLTLGVFVVAGLCAAVAGMIAAADIKEADVATCGLYLELDAILAVVLGGTPLLGGRANIIGSLVGALTMQTISTTLAMRGVATEHTLLIKGAFVLVATLPQSPVLLGRVR